MGHSALGTMCRLLQDPNFQRDVKLLRGAVFYINMGLWGTHRISKLKVTATSVLPSFYQVNLFNIKQVRLLLIWYASNKIYFYFSRH